MQTILGASGRIAEELARELRRRFATDIRLVSRNPKKINETDAAFSADLPECDNIFVSQKFKTRFPEFKATAYRDGIVYLMNEQKR